MDSFILYNAELDLPTEIEAPEMEIINKTTVKIEEISENKETTDDQEIPEETKQLAPVKKRFKTIDEDYEHEILWHLEFDGSVNRLGAGAGIWLHNVENNYAEGHAYRLNFKCTNNMAEYEALLLGLKHVKKLGGIRVSIIGDSELIIQ